MRICMNALLKTIFGVFVFLDFNKEVYVSAIQILLKFINILYSSELGALHKWEQNEQIDYSV